LPGSLVYLDASALVKLVVSEPETSALTGFLADREGRVTSRISAVEVGRAGRRAGSAIIAERAEGALRSIAFIELSPEIARLAGQLDPPTLRSLDAVHVASAVSLGADAGPFVAYDIRLTEAAVAAGLEVTAPA
jgi:predicted nucleic acid-binding protein